MGQTAPHREGNMSDRYHVQVRVREGRGHAWRRVHPVNGDPYVFTRDQAEQYIKTQSKAYGHYPTSWRLEELPSLSASASPE